MPVINFPAVIREKLGEEATEALVKVFNEIEKSIKEDSFVILEEKFEKRLSEELSKLRAEISEIKTSLREEISETKASLRTEISEIKASLMEEISETKASLRAEISETKAFLVRWMFIFWAGQIAVIIGLVSFLK
ncbi:MAG: LA_3696 family protein [Candidatus Ratteibacteria bacterium]